MTNYLSVQIGTDTTNESYFYFVDSEDLWNYLQIKQDHNIWIIDRLEDYDPCNEYIYCNESDKYYLPLNTALHIALSERNNMGFKLRQYFINAERENSTPDLFSRPDLNLMITQD